MTDSIKLTPGDILLAFGTAHHTVEIRADLQTREEGRVYRFVVTLSDHRGGSQSFGMHASAAPDLAKHTDLTRAEAATIERKLREIGELVRRWDTLA